MARCVVDRQPAAVVSARVAVLHTTVARTASVRRGRVATGLLVGLPRRCVVAISRAIMSLRMWREEVQKSRARSVAQSLCSSYHLCTLVAEILMYESACDRSALVAEHDDCLLSLIVISARLALLHVACQVQAYNVKRNFENCLREPFIPWTH